MHLYPNHSQHFLNEDLVLTLAYSFYMIILTFPNIISNKGMTYYHVPFTLER